MSLKQKICDGLFKKGRIAVDMLFIKDLLPIIEQEIWLKIEKRKSKWYNDWRFNIACYTGEDIFAELSQIQQDIKKLFNK